MNNSNKKMLNNFKYIILLLDCHGKILYGNQEALYTLKYTRDELLSFTIFNLISPDKKEFLLNKFKSNFYQEFYFHTFYITKGNLKLPVEVYFTIIAFNSNKIIINIIRDITLESNQINYISSISSVQSKLNEHPKQSQLKGDHHKFSSTYKKLPLKKELKNNYMELKRAKMKAENANIEKTNFLVNIRHEIKTPLNGIIGTIDFISLMELKECTKPYLQILRDCSTHLLDITNDILDISKIESGKIELHMKIFNLKNMLDTFIREISYICSDKNIKFTYFIDPLIPFELLGDELKLKQILINIFNNSLKFTQKGYILFNIKKISQINEKIILEFSIKDTGIGIKEKYKNQIFKKFIHHETACLSTGLGLLISKELVKIMNGDIWFESTENIGSTFSFTSEFFLYSNENSELLDLEKKFNSSHTPKKNILIAEDNEINMFIACSMLKNLGYNFIKAYNGNEALKILQTLNVDLVLTDIQMPELNGLEVTKIIRKNELNQKHHMPIIGMTSYSMIGDRELYIEEGMDDYISKPLDKHSLKNTLKKFL